MAAASSAGAAAALLRLPLIDDWHLHVRDGETMRALIRDLPLTVSRAIIMPNLKPPVTTATAAAAYRDRILAARPPGSLFQPLMTLYLTDRTSAADIDAAVSTGFIHGVKLYPAGATTHSDAGVTDVRKALPALRRMAEVGLPLLVHGEVTDASVDVFDREAVFIETVLKPLLEELPTLRVVMEHITTSEAAAFVSAAGPNIAATITTHHLLYNRNGEESRKSSVRGVPSSCICRRSRSCSSLPPAALFEGGLRPHRYCLPILKAESHRLALVAAATSGNRRFFLGTDSAPHTRAAKECACGAAGMFTALAAVELYAMIFERAGALDQLRAFACENGPDFYHLPRNADLHPHTHIHLSREEWRLPDTVRLRLPDEGEDAAASAGAAGSGASSAPSEAAVVVPIMSGETLPIKARIETLA